YPPKGPQDYVLAGYRAVTPGYLATLGVPLRSGRLLDERDHEGAPAVVVINESMARQFFPGINPIGQRIQIGTEPSSSDPTLEIVGVVGDVKQAFATESKAEMFVPYGQYPDPVLVGAYLNTALVVRACDPPSPRSTPASRSSEYEPWKPRSPGPSHSRGCRRCCWSCSRPSPRRSRWWASTA
ncbi:MAG: ABC transporter permease, partial [Acidobacteriota bacterium]